MCLSTPYVLPVMMVMRRSRKKKEENKKNMIMSCVWIMFVCIDCVIAFRFMEDRNKPDYPHTMGNQAMHCTFEPALDEDNEFMKKLPNKPFLDRCFDFTRKLEKVQR
jgi:hypothetical protein